MKRILITGADSYIGISFEKWLSADPSAYKIETLDMRVDSWKNKNFSEYDAVFHVAGIAHVKETKTNRDLFYKVNRDLVYETAVKAKHEGVKQFLFLSSMSVYGVSDGMICKDTPIHPNNEYGRSKFQAEEMIMPLNSDSFKVAILRPPMIYGKNCKGNYQKLARVARKTIVFPDIRNQRSMLHIDNLCEFVKLVVDQMDSGVFFPQNSEFVRTSEMVKLIAEVHGRKIWLLSGLNGIIQSLAKRIDIFNKVFGNLVYEKSMSDYKKEYRVNDFVKSIQYTEKQAQDWMH